MAWEGLVLIRALSKQARVLSHLGFGAAFFGVVGMQFVPKGMDPALKARPVRLVTDHQQGYPSHTAAIVPVARQVGVRRSRCAAGWRRNRWTPVRVPGSEQREGMGRSSG